VFTAVDTQGTRGASTVDFGSGVYWVRASGKKGDVVGAPGPTQKLVLEPRAKITTEHFLVFGPYESRATVERLAGLAEKALSFYRGYLRADTFPERQGITFYATDEGFEMAARHFEDNTVRKHHAGFTHGSDVFIRWRSSGRHDGEGPDFLDVTVAHELVHLLQNKRPRFWEIPPWFVESAAEFLSVAALSEIYGFPGTRLQDLTGRYTRARRAVREGYLIPLSQFLEADRKGFSLENAAATALFYSEAAGVLFGSAEPPQRMRDFFRAVWQADFNWPFVVSHELKRLGTIDDLEAGVRRWAMRARSSLPAGDLHGQVLPNDELRFETIGRDYGITQDDTHHTHGRVELDGEPGEKTNFYQILFGIGNDTGYATRVTAEHKLELRQWSKVGNKALASVEIAPGRHVLEVRFDAAHASIFVDGQPALDAPLPTPPSGSCGLGISRGELLVRRWRVAD
jgi:hypothetical protein